MQLELQGKYTGVKFSNRTYDYIIGSCVKHNLLSMNSEISYIVTILDGSNEFWKKTEKEIKSSLMNGNWIILE